MLNFKHISKLSQANVYTLLKTQVRMNTIDTIKYKLTLNDGNEMPVFGLGCWAMDNGPEVSNAILHAVKAGYTLFDTAAVYKNEEMVGKTLRESGLRRDEYFVVSKLNPVNHGFNNTKENVRASLDRLGTGFIDLFLIHSPRNGQLVETWKALVECKQEGLVKSIGVSNFNKQHLEPLLSRGLEVPAVNQIELNPWNQQSEAVKFCEQKKIALMGYCPLARNRHFEEGKYPVLDSICKQLNQTKAQVVLRWAVERNFITIPKSSNAGRIKENSMIFDWSLTDAMMSSINNLDENLICSSATQVMNEPYAE